MEREIDLELYFCPECKQEAICAEYSVYCGRCGTKIMKVEMIVCMDGEKISRLLLKGSR